MNAFAARDAGRSAAGPGTVRASPTGLDRKTLSGPSLLMMSLSASAPLTGVIGGLVAAYSFGVVGVPAACLAVMVGWGLFTIGYTAVGRHVPHAAPFYAQVARGSAPGRRGGGRGGGAAGVRRDHLLLVRAARCDVGRVLRRPVVGVGAGGVGNRWPRSGWRTSG